MAKEILVAESDKMVQEELERIFETSAHHLFFATSDEEALLRGKLFKPDLIIGGKHLCQAVRAEQGLEQTPFIILLDMFEDLSEQERVYLRADGIISRPLDEDKILSLVDHFSEGARGGAERKPPSMDQTDWKSFSDIGTKKTDLGGGFSLDESWESDEEIIELVDVVEEPEPRMSIDDFALQPKEELIGEIAPIESWGGPAKEAEDLTKDFVLPSEEKEEFKEDSLDLEEEAIEKIVSPEDELFEKIELEEILRKVERLQPSIEKEFPVEREEHRIPEIIPEKIAPPVQKPDGRYTRLDEFEAAIKGEVKGEPSEQTLPRLFHEEMPQETSKLPLSVESFSDLELQELGEEEFPEVFLEELVGELEKLKEEEPSPEKTAVEVEAEIPLEEEISELLGEDIQPLQKPLEEVTLMEVAPPFQTLPPSNEMPLVDALVQAEGLEEPWITAPGVTEAPKVSIEEVPPPVRRLDLKIEEVLTRGLQEMMQDFVNKVIPEITTQMMTLTLDRIEQMVKEVVPDLAEKAIQDEIQRLQKGEKD